MGARFDTSEQARDAFAGLHPGDHIGCIYSEPKERDMLLAAYVLDGLQGNERVICAVEEDALYRACRLYSVDIGPYHSSGQLEIIAPEDFYLEDGCFDSPEPLQRGPERKEQAKKEGYAGLRLCGELPATATRTASPGEILDYEARFDQFVADSGSRGLCFYDRNTCPSEVLRQLLHTHPVMAVGSRLYRNFYYTAPGTHRDEKASDEALQRWLDNLVEHRNLQDQLSKMGNRYRAIFENSGAAIAIIEDDTTLSLINPEFERLVGYSREEVEGRMSWTQVVAPGDRERMRGYHRRRRQNPRAAPESYEFRLMDKEGNIKHAFLKVGLIPGTDRSTASILDISERKKMQEKLRQSEREKDMILQSTPGHIIYLDTELTIRWLSEGAAQDAGEAREAMKGRKCYEVWHDSDEPCETCPVREAMKTGRECVCEQTVPDGRTFVLHGRPVRDENGHIVGVVEAGLNITERKKTQKNLEESRRRLRALTERLQNLQEEERRRLSRRIHDEVGHQLTAMKIGLSQLEKQVEEDSADASALKDEVEDLSELVDETIESVHQVSKQLRPDALDDLGLKPALETEVEDFQERTGIECSFRYVPSAGQQDDERGTALFRICQELLNNVARHADATRVEVSLEESDGEIHLRVSDNGCGMTEDEAVGAESLGLLGVRERARALDGGLSIDGQPGEGTTVTVSIAAPGPTTDEPYEQES